MQEQIGKQHHINHATFALPPLLLDKTVHMFTLKDSGPSEFVVVISYAAVKPEETLADVGERMLSEIGKELARFTLAGSQERLLDGVPALELHYSWRNDGAFVYQRQLIAIVPDVQPGTRQLMLIGATCARPLTTEWNAAFDDILDTMQLRHAPVKAANEAIAQPPEAATTVFALSETRRTLHSFADADNACRRVDTFEVEEQRWSFFDALGAPLRARFTTPNSGTMWRKSGIFVLEAWPHGTPLRERLHEVAEFVPNLRVVPFATLAHLRTYLDEALTGHW